MIPLQKRLVLALDTPDVETALDLVKRTKDAVGTYKIGLELFTAAGPSVVERVRKEGGDVFLDLKLHDIPSTVGAAVREAARLGVSLLTIHALGGAKMIRAAVDAVQQQTAIPGYPPPRILAVTILTHHTGDDLRALGVAGDALAAATRLAAAAKEAGAHGVVCSPEEARAVKTAGGASFLVVCPGIRPKEAPLGDQARTATPFEAVRDGADYVVVGRPIRTAADPAGAAAAILADVAKGLEARA